MTLSVVAKRGLAGALVAAVLLAVATVVVVTRGDDPASTPETAGDVRPGRDNVVAAADGSVVVTIPGDAIEEPGRLTIEPVLAPDGAEGWAIELTGGELVGKATIRFAVPDLPEDEPTPLVTFSRTAGAARQAAADVTREDEAVIVVTEHFSNWFVDRWGELLGIATDWVARRLDEAASITPDRAPRCKGEQTVRDNGYEVTSDSGRRVYWCLGLVDDAPTLKAVNGRGFGVVTEHTAGLRISQRDRGGLVDIVAGLLTPPPTQRGNTTGLLSSGSKIELAVSPTKPLVGVRFTPDPGAYLLSALQYGVSTYTMLMERLGVNGTTEKLLRVLQGEQCLVALSGLATSELATPQEAQEFFGTALGLAFDCVGLAADQIDLGVLNEVIVAPLVWLLSGLKTAADGLVAAADLGFDPDGYQIRVSHAVAPEISEETVGELLVPPGTCGDGTTFGWDQVEAIQLSGGEGEAFDSELVGAGVLGTSLVGSVDVTGDGVEEAVVVLTCTGSPKDLCCAGRTSLLDFVAVFDLSGDIPRRVGNTIAPVDVPGPSGYDESRYFQGEDVTLDGMTVVTYQTLVYPEQLDPDDVARLEGDVRYTLQGDRWVPSS